MEKKEEEAPGTETGAVSVGEALLVHLAVALVEGGDGDDPSFKG